MAAGAGGGIPFVKRFEVPTTGQMVKLPFFTLYLVARNKGANVIRMYFTETDFTDDANYVELPIAAATDPHGEWRGPVETAHDKYANIYLKAITAAANVEVVAFQRRG